MTSEYRRSAAIASPAASRSSSSGTSTGATSAAELPGQARAGLQQQAQRDRLGRAERQQPQQPGRARRGLLQVLERQPQVVATVLWYPAGSPRAEQVRAPLPERGQVPGQAVPVPACT